MSSLNGWRYYNHAMIPTTAPHEMPDLVPLEDGSIWSADKSGRKPLLARWTSDFDCGFETEWWYCIKDTPFEMSSLKSNTRYKINKGNRYFDVHIITPSDYSEELYEIQVEAFSAYPTLYRQTVNKEQFILSINNWNCITYGAFSRKDGKMCGYARCKEYDLYASLSVCKTIPSYEKYQINAAIVYTILQGYNTRIESGYYIVDGERNILHLTNYQEYLEKYFCFRKAYCKLNIRYNRWIKQAVRILYPFRKALLKIDFINIIHQTNAVLKMEEIVRNNKYRGIK